mgnify:CR=1 FL=1
MIDIPDLVTRLELALDVAIGDSFSVEGEFCCNADERAGMAKEREETEKAIREAIASLLAQGEARDG